MASDWEFAKWNNETQEGYVRMATAEALRNDAYARDSEAFRRGLIPFLDGNQWCVLLGANLQEGIAGFGDTPATACKAFDKAWYTPALQEAKDGR